jgi:hypothetical protein
VDLFPQGSSLSKKPKLPLLQVRPIPEDLLHRINMAAEAEGVTQAQFVIEVLDEETKDMRAVQAARNEKRKKRAESR